VGQPRTPPTVMNRTQQNSTVAWCGQLISKTHPNFASTKLQWQCGFGLALEYVLKSLALALTALALALGRWDLWPCELNWFIVCDMMTLLLYRQCYTYHVVAQLEITYPTVQPVYINSGGKLQLVCEAQPPFRLQWNRTLFERQGNGRRQYEMINTSSSGGFVITEQVNNSRVRTELEKTNVSVADAGSYKCSRTNDPEMSDAVDVNILHG